VQPSVADTSDGGLALVLTDITSQRDAIRRESDARVQAESCSRAKSEFLANVSHEVRTPLNAILGMTQVLSNEPSGGLQRERFDVIAAAGRNLLAVIDDIMEIALLEGGRLEIAQNVIDLGTVVSEATAACAGACEAKGLAFSLEIADTAHGFWLGDAGHLRRVIAKIAGNAAKFTDTGAVVIRVTGSSEGVEVAVIDTGIGVAPDQAEMIFDAFSQVDSSAARRAGGAGLGLAIARRLAVAMNGDLKLDSRLGQGSVFTLRLPLRRASKVTSDTPIETRGAEEVGVLKILIAEDNPANQLVLRALLEPIDADLTVVGDGRAAVEAWQQGAFDLILMDIQMPEMTGLEATREIRGLEAKDGRAPTPIVAVTANVINHQIAEYRLAGMNGWVAKPIEFSALVRAIEAALIPADRETSDTPPARAAA
jgi:CheY-like chemotaxis protein/nitrogen-specific signal transduction histidine kinase